MILEALAIAGTLLALGFWSLQVQRRGPGLPRTLGRLAFSVTLLAALLTLAGLLYLDLFGAPALEAAPPSERQSTLARELTTAMNLALAGWIAAGLAATLALAGTLAKPRATPA